MKKNWQTFNGKLGSVKENFFTVRGSPFYYVPKNKKLLLVLGGWYAGTQISINGYRMSKDSQFISVGKVSLDRYKSKIRAGTRRVKAYAEMDEQTVKAQTGKMHINGGGTHTGLSATQGKEKRKLTRAGSLIHVGYESPDSIERRNKDDV